ncbi:ABC transporter ATP-binding protein [Campylobacter mucosalis]|uniref:Iron ABC transporter, ATP-binding protein n=1 Tax=Campylobacter mucosalis CCUG 21559 TaxID=1032067 RepID=A0A6G5QF72_9BACT|nr:ABC transporter ATP-binding protein [Campylobacter mucosalis]QCD44292.1 iron ABC transporter, ATP-binding protein [Campylobacter mucosalis CCUG 21559]
MLELKNLEIYRGDLCVANKVNTNFKSGKTYGILGPNGAGKTSLLTAIFGDLDFSGEIKFKDKTLSFKNHFSWKKQIAYMPQDSLVDASLTALEVVLLGLLDSLGLYVSDEQLSKAVSIMDELGILHLASKDVTKLSGGQRQMVMFASVLIKSPKIILLDEPVSALDMHHSCILLDYVKKFTKERDLTTIMILHDLSLASQFCDELILLNKAEIKAQGAPKEVLTKDIIKELYRVKADIFYCSDGQPVVIAKQAIK